MSGKKLSLIALGFMLVGAGCAKGPPPPPTPSTVQEAAYVLTALNGTTPYDRAPVPTQFGCEDRLALQRISVPKSDRPALEVNMNKLFSMTAAQTEALGLYSPFADKGLRAEVSVENEKTVMNIVGEFAPAGECDDPRIKKMVEETVKLSTADAVDIRLNGSQKDWRCQGDLSGRCK